MSNEVESEETDPEIYKTLGYEDQSDYFDKRLPIYNDFLSFEEYSKQLEAKSIPDIVENLDDTEIKFSEEPVEFDYTPNMFYANLAKDAYENVGDRKGFLKYKYIEDESSENLATYINEEKKELAFSIPGTRGISDGIMNTGIGLGLLGGPVFLDIDNRYEKISNKIKEVKNKYDDYSVSVTGHSAGGSLANYLGVDNPDYAVNTFNMAQGLPFLTNTVKCKLGFGNCDNINNFRIVGDWTSALPLKPGKVFNLKPIINDEMNLQAESQETFYYPTYMGLPHNINQFIDRDKNQELPDYGQYGRRLAANLAGITAAVGLPFAVNKIDSALKFVPKNYFVDLFDPAFREQFSDEVDVKIQGYMNKIQRLGQYELLGISDVTDEVEYDYSMEGLAKIAEPIILQNNPSLRYASNFFGGLANMNEGLSSFLGFGAGELAGTLLYESLLKPEVSELKGTKEDVGDAEALAKISLGVGAVLLSDILANKYTNRFQDGPDDILENHYAYISPENFP